MMGSTKESFVINFINHSKRDITPAKIKTELDGMAKWHKIIGSTPPAFFDVETLQVEIIKFWISMVLAGERPVTEGEK